MEKLIYGHRVEIEMYKDMLNKEGIECYIKNEFEQAAQVGFGSGIPGNADLMVDKADYDKAKKIIDDYKK